MAAEKNKDKEKEAKLKALQLTLDKLDKSYGKGSVMKLGDKVIEDVRMHRVVFCKSMTFRWFADVEPERDGIIIKIQKSRKDPIQIIQIKKDQEISEYTQIIKDAFEEIH